MAGIAQHEFQFLDVQELWKIFQIKIYNWVKPTQVTRSFISWAIQKGVCVDIQKIKSQ